MFWMGSPSIAPRPAFVLAQTAPSFQIPVEQQPASRLDSLSITAIQNRILIDPAVQRYVAAKAAYAASRPRGFRGAPIPIDSALVPLYAAAEPSLTEDEKTILTAIQANPTDDEIADLALIDGFFRAADAPKFVNANPDLPLTEGVCAALNPQGYGLHGLGMVAWGAKPLTQGGAIAGWLKYQPPQGKFASRTSPNATADEIDAITSSKFFCETPASWPDPSGIRLDWPSWFGIDQNQTWGAIKLQVKNAVKMMDGIFNYPFPPPIDAYVFQFWNTVQPLLQQYVKGDPIEPEGFRYWITIQVLQNYNDMVDRIEADLKRKAKKAKRKALLKAIGIAIVGIIAPYLLPVLVVAAATLIKLAIDTYMTLEARRQAAKEMAEAGKLFEADAPKFAVEVRNLSDMMDSEAAQAEAAIPLPPDLIEELGTPPPAVQPLIFGTGVAAAIGLTVLAIFKK
jgi:hypothetical protein